MRGHGFAASLRFSKLQGRNGAHGLFINEVDKALTHFFLADKIFFNLMFLNHGSQLLKGWEFALVFRRA